MRRPRSVTLLCIIVAGLAVFQAIGAAAAWQQQAYLAALPLSVPPAYLPARDAVWAAALAAWAAALWRQAPWARAGGLAVAGLFLAHNWLDRLLLARAAFVQTTLGWTALVDVLTALFVLYTLRRRPAVSAGRA